jgi:tRNA (guanine-N7-)-methyltransferase
MEKDEELRPVDRAIRTYVLRAGRMTDAQRKALKEEGPRYCVPVVAGSPFDWPAIFGNGHPVIAEIGFGMGQATWQLAAAHPELNYLGFEVHTPGVGKLLSQIADHGIENLRIVHHDAVEAFESVVPEASLAGLHVFYPDPWPKKRHHKRRLMRPGIIELLVSRLMPGAYLYFVTDVEEYAEWTLELLSHVPGMKNLHEGLAPRQAWRPETKFEVRASRDGRGVYELLFERVDGGIKVT